MAYAKGYTAAPCDCGARGPLGLTKSLFGGDFPGIRDLEVEQCLQGGIAEYHPGLRVRVNAPQVGRLIDRTGARTLMASGSALYAVSLAALAFSQGLVSYLLCWAAMGVASTLALSTPSSIAIAQVAGLGARRAIAMLAIIGGFASTVFWPLSGALDVAVGWRGTLLVYAAIHLFACLPVHLLVLPRQPPAHHLAAAANPAASGVPSEVRRQVFLLLSVTLSSGAFVFTGAMVHMIELMRGLGHPAASAVLLASLIGPSQVTVRVFELLFGHRYSIMNSAVS